MELIIGGVKEGLSALVKMMSKEKAMEMYESSHIDKTPIYLHLLSKIAFKGKKWEIIGDEKKRIG